MTNLQTFALEAVDAYRASVDASSRPIDRRTAKARFKGMVAAARALGVAQTTLTIEEAITTAVRDAGERPAFRASGNNPQQDFDWAVARSVALSLG